MKGFFWQTFSWRDFSCSLYFLYETILRNEITPGFLKIFSRLYIRKYIVRYFLIFGGRR